jgi:TonB family protein
MTGGRVIPRRFAIATFVICSAMLWAQSKTTNEQKQAVPPSNSNSPSDTTQPLLALPIRFCTQKNPPHCVTPPRAVFQPDPEYSEDARHAHYEGVSVLLVIVGTDGKVYDPKVLRAVGLGLDEKATEAVRQWVFQPAIKDGKPVAIPVSVEVDFRLDSVSVLPPSAEVAAGAKRQFSATIPGARNSTVKWSVSGPGCAASECGTISDDGLYTAPGTVPNPSIVTVKAVSATDPTKTGIARVKILPSR